MQQINALLTDHELQIKLQYNDIFILTFVSL